MEQFVESSKTEEERKVKRAHDDYEPEALKLPQIRKAVALRATEK
jgi:hypothetical protein